MQQAPRRNPASCLLCHPYGYDDASPAPQKGFALLIAVIFMSVMLSFGLTLGSIAYKQQVLASGAIQSQYAFYAADAALECALYADQKINLFAYGNYEPSNPTKTMTCDGAVIVVNQVRSPSRLVSTARISLDGNKHCADVTIFKPSGLGTSYLFAEGYNVSCSTVGDANVRISVRGIQAHY